MDNKNKPQYLAGCWGSEAISSAKRYLKHSTQVFIVDRKSSGVKTLGTADGPGGADE